jgi:hypothetical protein
MTLECALSEQRPGDRLYDCTGNGDPMVQRNNLANALSSSLARAVSIVTTLPLKREAV